MKTKIKIMVLALLTVTLSGVNAADNVLYEATASPGLIPDSGSVDVWTVTGDGGSDRSYLQGMQDGNANMWTIWDLDGGGGTYADHSFAGGALLEGQTVSIDYAHNTNINSGRTIGIRFMNGTTSEAEFVFIGGDDYFSKYDTGSGVYELTNKRYDNYDLFQVKFSLTGPNSYIISVTEGSIIDEGWKGSDDANADLGAVVAVWEGTFTGADIDGIQVYTEGGGTSDQWFDNLDISDEWLSAVHNYSPGNGAVDVLVSGFEFKWDIPQARTSTPGVFTPASGLDYFNLYYQLDDPNLLDVTPIVVSGWNTSTLQASAAPTAELSKNSVCYWRVDTVYTNSTVVEGDPLSFETELTKAIINSQTEFVSVAPEATALISVDIFSETEATYQWYKYVDGENDEQLADSGDISGTATDTLSIANAEVADEGEYYCIINNSSGVPVPSVPALLSVKRKIAYWTFEDKGLDSVIPGSPASVIVGDPNFMPDGIIGECIAFDSGVDFLYTEPAQVSYFDDCDYSMTVACWVKTDDTQDWCPLVAKNGEGEGWQLRHHGNSKRPCFTTRGTGEDDGTPANRTIYDNQWHYVVGTFDGTVKKVYIDGVVSVVYSSDDGSFVKDGDQVSIPINASVSPVAIGGRVRVNDENTEIEVWNNTAGLYDEVEIFNYALDEITIAQNYANITGQDVCLGQVYDINGNCIVDIADFAELASEWLSNAVVAPELD